MKPIPRQQIPQDSFCNELSEIRQMQPVDRYGSVLGVNDRNPQCQNSHEMETYVKWINYSLPTDSGSTSTLTTTKQPHQLQTPRAQSKWSRKKISDSIYLSLNLGEQKRINQVNVSFSNKDRSMNQTMLLNAGEGTLANPDKHSKSQCWKSIRTSKHQQIVPANVQGSSEMSLYKIEHECNITFKRLLEVELSNQMLSYQISLLRRHLIQCRSIVSKNKDLEHKFQPLMDEIESILQIVSHVEVSYYRLNQLQQTVKGIVRNIYQADTLRKLVKVVSVKRVLAQMNKIQNEFSELMKTKKSYINGSNMLMSLEDKIRENITEIKEVLELFPESELRRSLKSTRYQVIEMLKQQKNTTQVQREVLLEIGSSLP